LTSHAGNPLGSNVGIVEETADWIALGKHAPTGATGDIPAYVTVTTP
jgi:hypothetical protein